jgi:hypothetical protein
MVANQGQITKINTNPNAGLVDGSDKLHSGILKALTAFNKGDVCIGHAGFTITDGGTYTQYNLAQPIHYFYNNNYKTYGTNLTVAYSSPGVQDSTHDRYDWVLLNPNNGGTPSLVIVQGGAASNPTVADITADYIPIALIKIDAASTSDDDKTNYSFQLYTLNKQANSLSIGYDAGTYFAESGKITGDADSIDIVTSITNADINITPNGDGKIVLDGLNWPIADGNTGEFLKTNGSNQLSFSAVSIPASPAIEDNSGTPVLASGITETEVRSLLNVENADFISAVEGEATLDLTGDVTIGDKKLIVDTTTLVVNAPSYTNRVGIGTATPSNTLDVNGDVSGDKFLVETVQYELEILSNAGATPGPPTPAFSLADTDTIYRVSTVAGTPPGTGNIDLSLPATASNIGVVFKLIVTALDGASPLTIGPNSGDNIVSETLSVLAASGATHTISSAGVYELVCFSGSWMFYKIA